MLRAPEGVGHPPPRRHVRRRHGGAVMLLALVVFLFVTGLIVAVYFASVTGAKNQEIDRRLREVSASQAVPETGPADSTVVKRSAEGPLPVIDRLLSSTGGGGGLAHLIEQSGV